MGQAYASFPRMFDYEAVACTFAPGVEPSTCTIVTKTQLLQAGILQGDLTLTYIHDGDTQVIQWRDAVVKDVAVELDNTITLTILDRRWKWQFTYGVSAWFNQRKADDVTVIPRTEKTPREIASFLLDAMGEVGYDVSRLPNDARPECRWDVANPSQELEKLCSDLGCRVVLNLSSNVVQVWPLGQGTLIPVLAQSLIAPQYSESGRVKPDSVEAMSAPIQLQTRWNLEAVGEDRNGEIVPIDELSYVPQGGRFSHDMGNVLDEDDAVLAKRSVYRYYRITGPVSDLPGDFSFDGLPHIEFETDKLDLQDDQARHAATAHGTFYGGETLLANKTGAWEDEPSFDARKRLVRFASPCWQLDNNGVEQAADMVLETTCKMRNRDTGGLVRRYVETTTDGQRLGTGPLEIRRDDVLCVYRHAFDEHNVRQVTGTTTSEPDTDAQLQEIVNAEIDSWRITPSGQGQYVGLIAFELDGLRDSVSWTFGTQQAPKTVLTANSQVNPYLPGEEERKRNRALSRMLARATANELQAND